MRRTDHDPSARRPCLAGFTLIELLVVITIIALISVVTLPTIVSALSEREVLDAAGMLQASLTVARDTAARTGNATGVRLLLDPDISINNTGPLPLKPTLAANRMISITQAPDYNSGSIIVRELTWVLNPTSATPVPIKFLLAVEDKTVPVSYQPTSWYWNVRQGEKVRINGAGRFYTIGGPLQTANANRNPERYLNLDLPASTTPVVSLPPNVLVNNYNSYGLAPPLLYPTIPTNFQPTTPPNALPIAYINATGSEYMYLFNGLDDDGDGLVDEAFDGVDNDGDGIIDPAFDGVDNDGNGVIDDPAELGFNYNPLVPSSGEYEPESLDLTTRGKYLNVPGGLPYVITRKPVVAEGAREVVLPANIVIDLTMLNQTPLSPSGVRPERSRLPMDLNNGSVDILFGANGQVLEDQVGVNVWKYNKNLPFYHFWLASKSDVFAPDLALLTGPYLPTPSAKTTQGGPLKGERRLVTLFPKTGNITINSLEDFSSLESPYQDAQTGTREP
jgi:prepilin-type N-terminal cleavage/methylation domain-containing protein